MLGKIVYLQKEFLKNNYKPKDKQEVGRPSLRWKDKQALPEDGTCQ